MIIIIIFLENYFLSKRSLEDISVMVTLKSVDIISEILFDNKKYTYVYTFCAKL